MFDEQVVQLSDELARQLLLVGLLGDQRHPGFAEAVDEAREGNNERLAKERGFRTEVTEQQVLRDAGCLGDLAGRRAAVVLTREQFTSSIEEQPSRLASRPSCRLRRGSSSFSWPGHKIVDTILWIPA